MNPTRPEGNSSDGLIVVRTILSNPTWILTEAMRIAKMAERAGKLCCPHSFTDALAIVANAHLVAASPNRLVLEYCTVYNPLVTGLLKDPLVPVQGYIDLPNKPGLEVELNENALNHFPYLEGDPWAPLEILR